MGKLSLSRVASAVFLLALAAHSPVRADSGTFSLGYGSRFVGMAGAGLAVTDTPTQAALLNPAAYALRGSGIGVQWPSIHAGVSSAALNDALDEIGGDAIGQDKAEKLALDLGKEPTRLQLQIVPVGLAAGQFGLNGLVQADAFIAPRPLFSAFANSGLRANELGTWLQGQPLVSAPLLAINPFGLTPAQLEAAVTTAVNTIGAELGADVAGVAAAGPALGMGMRLRGEQLSDVSIGIRLKALRLFYSRWTVQPALDGPITAADFNATGQFAAWNKLRLQATGGIEMGGKDSLEKTAFGLDFGVLWQPSTMPRTTFALTVDNLVEPNFKVPSTAVGVPSRGKNIMPRTVNVGVAYQAPGNLLLCADLVDLTGATEHRPDGKTQFRVGIDWRPPVPALRFLSLQAGYNSASGPAVGLAFCPSGVRIGIAVAKGLPVMANQSFNF